MSREIIPVLARAIAPLQPTRNEIDAVVQELRHAKHTFGRKLRVDELLTRLAAVSPQSPACDAAQTDLVARHRSR